MNTRETAETRADDRPDVGTRCAVCAGPCIVAGQRGAYSAAVPVLAWVTEREVTDAYGGQSAALRGQMTTDSDGRVAVCDRCVALATRWAVADGRPAVGYVNADGTAVTSWGGTHVARIVRSSRLRSTFGGDGLAWSAELPSGVKCYGRNGGRGTITSIRRSVAR